MNILSFGQPGFLLSSNSFSSQCSHRLSSFYVLIYAFLSALDSYVFPYSDLPCLVRAMSCDNSEPAWSAVATKGPRKRQKSETDSRDRVDEEFRGCRDSPSPVRPERAYRESKSKPLHHRIVLETPLMHRHDLEWQMEELWENYAIEYKFLRST